jgi:hypothetical protein
LETKYPQIYRILDKDFPFYQDSYRSKLNEEVSSMLKEDARELFKILKGTRRNNNSSDEF